MRTYQLLPLLLAASCVLPVKVGPLHYTATGPESAPRDANCSFQIFSTPPSSAYDELGVVEVAPGKFGTMDLSVWKQEISSHVCRAGGDGAIVFTINGAYYKAAVVKLR